MRARKFVVVVDCSRIFQGKARIFAYIVNSSLDFLNLTLKVLPTLDKLLFVSYFCGKIYEEFQLIVFMASYYICFN